MTLRSTIQSGKGVIQSIMGQIKTTPRGVLVCKVAFITVCVVMALSGRHPPANAQATEDKAGYYGLAINSAVQTKRLDDLIERMDKLDGRMDKMWNGQNANAQAIAGAQGENRGIFALLAAIQGGSFVLGRKRSKGSDS